MSSSFALRGRLATKSIPSDTILASRVASAPQSRNRPGKLRHLRCSCSPICTVSSRGSAKTDLGVRRYLSTTNPASIGLVTVLPLPSNASAEYSHSAWSSFMIWSRSVTAACCSFVLKKIWGAMAASQRCSRRWRDRSRSHRRRMMCQTDSLRAGGSVAAPLVNRARWLASIFTTLASAFA